MVVSFEECRLPMFASLTQPLLIVAASVQRGQAAESAVMGAAGASRDQVPTDASLDRIALGLVKSESSSAAMARKKQMSRPLRQHVLLSAGLQDEEQPSDSEACRAKSSETEALGIARCRPACPLSIRNSSCRI